MLLAIWITLLNAMGSSNGFINPARVNLAGEVPIGLMELSIAAGFLWAVFRGGDAHSSYPRLRMHPLVSWLMLLWGVSWLCGTLGSLASIAPGREILQSMRDYAMVPICIFIGYRTLSTPQSVKRMAYWIMIAGLGEAIVLLLRFNEASSLVRQDSDNVNPLRQIDFMTAYCSIAFVVCVYSLISGVRIFPAWLRALVGPVCLLGACSSVSRTTLVCIFFSLVGILFLLPRGKRASGILKLVLFSPVVIFALWAGISVASNLIHKDFSKVMSKMVDSVVPESEDDGLKKDKAWDTRIPSLKVELELFSTSPLFGRGFTAVTDYISHGGTNWGAFGHNSYTLLMARTGVVGLSAFALLIGSMIVVSWRMVNEKVDSASMVMGVVGFVSGCFILIAAGCTMMFNSRGAMYFAPIGGFIVRAREIQETTRELNRQSLDPVLEDEPYLDLSRDLEPAGRL